MYNNFIHIHQTERATPAQKAKIAYKLWTIGYFFELLNEIIQIDKI